MIAIVNVSTHEDNYGLNQYELRINSRVIAKFDHVRSEGLAVCLRKAAEAAERAHLDEVSKRLMKMWGLND